MLGPSVERASDSDRARCGRARALGIGAQRERARTHGALTAKLGGKRAADDPVPKQCALAERARFNRHRRRRVERAQQLGSAPVCRWQASALRRERYRHVLRLCASAPATLRRYGRHVDGSLLRAVARSFDSERVASGRFRDRARRSGPCLARHDVVGVRAYLYGRACNRAAVSRRFHCDDGRNRKSTRRHDARASPAASGQRAQRDGPDECPDGDRSDLELVV